MDSQSHDPSVVPVSCLVLTRNEEVNIADCLGNLSFSDDIVVLDSYSTDQTVQIARDTANTRVFQRHFDTEYKQRNFGLHDIEYRYPWVYICDADERIPKDLIAELREIVSDPNPAYAAYRLRYKNMYLGKWIKHATSYPVSIIRLVQPQKVVYEKRATNVHPLVEGETGQLQSHFTHYSFNNGLCHWFEKHNFYSNEESIEGLVVRRKGLPSIEELRHPEPMQRRRAIKNLSFFLRGRGLWRFLYQYFLRNGWMDGMAGFHYCAMISTYEYWIELKIREHEAQWSERTEATAREMGKDDNV